MPLEERTPSLPLQQRHDLGVSFRRQEMADGSVEVTHPRLLGSEPTPGPEMELGNQLRFFRPQAAPLEIGKELVIAIPASFTIERDEEKIVALQGLKKRFRRWDVVLILKEGVAERGGEALQD